MTFGEQDTLPQSLELLDRAFEFEINFFDSAEMCAHLYSALQFLYLQSLLSIFIFFGFWGKCPLPQRPETKGRSEEFIWHWIRSRKIPRETSLFRLQMTCIKFIALTGMFLCLEKLSLTRPEPFLLLAWRNNLVL